jgi:hypothetical protein
VPRQRVCGSARLKNIPEGCQCDDYFFSLKAVSKDADREHGSQPRRRQKGDTVTVRMGDGMVQ